MEVYGITDEEIAVMCASHNGEPQHLAAVRSILAKAVVNNYKTVIAANWCNLGIRRIISSLRWSYATA